MKKYILFASWGRVTSLVYHLTKPKLASFFLHAKIQSKSYEVSRWAVKPYRIM